MAMGESNIKPLCVSVMRNQFDDGAILLALCMSSKLSIENPLDNPGCSIESRGITHSSMPIS